MSPTQVHAFFSQYCSVKPVTGLSSELNETNENTHYLLPGKTNIGIAVFKSKKDIICYMTAEVNGKWVFFGNVVPYSLRKFKTSFRTDYGVNESKPGQFMPWITSILATLQVTQMKTAFIEFKTTMSGVDVVSTIRSRHNISNTFDSMIQTSPDKRFNIRYLEDKYGVLTTEHSNIVAAQLTDAGYTLLSFHSGTDEVTYESAEFLLNIEDEHDIMFKRSTLNEHGCSLIKAHKRIWVLINNKRFE